MKRIDAEITEEKIDDTEIKLDENNLDLVSITQIAQKYAIPETAALKILNVDYPDVYITIDSYLISKEKTITESADLLYHLLVLWADMDITRRMLAVAHF